MFKRALAILVIGVTSAGSFAAHASDWDNGAPRYAPPPAERYLNNRVEPRYPVRYAAPRYVVAPYRYAPPAYRWAPPTYRWAPAPQRVWYPAYAYRGYDDHRSYCPDR